MVGAQAKDGLIVQFELPVANRALNVSLETAMRLGLARATGLT